MSLKALIQQYAYDLGADLVGVGSIDRCKHAPPMMSPQGLYPAAQSVVVMALHHPDACIEIGGDQHPQVIGPYSVQYLMNSRLDEMSYRMATFIERQGYGAVPIVSSNIWRYNEYKDLKAVFAPDVSHIYMAVVAGLADLGFNGLALTREYGARNRFITVITDAVLDPDPLIPPGTICDRCMLCRKHCPSGALSLEIDGDKVVRIDPYEYRFPNKNLWRCAWGEHFDLDLDLTIPAAVTEPVILENVKQHGIRGGEMGQCLKFCVPKAIRTFDRAYSRTPMRRHWAQVDPDTMSRAVVDRLLTAAQTGGAEAVIVTSAEAMRAAGIDLETVLPGARSAITLAVAAPASANADPFRFGAQYQMDSLCFDLTRGLESLGFRSVMTISQSGSHPDGLSYRDLSGPAMAGIPSLPASTTLANTVVTRLAIAPQQRLPGATAARVDARKATASLTSTVADLARSLGADLVGVASAARIDELAGQLRPLFARETVLDARDKSIRFTPWDPEITSRNITVKTAADWLPGARSVLVFGLRMHEEVLRHATRPPAEAVGPYSFQTYVTNWLGSVIAYRLVKRLQELGYAAAIATDLTATDSVTASPRGPQPDLFSNRFAAVAAGLGWLADSGHLTTPEFGIRQRCIAIVTDAPLSPSPLRMPAGGENRCAQCEAKPCRTTCTTQALSSHTTRLACDGAAFDLPHIDRLRCDWCKRYALDGDCGFKFLGSPADVPAPEAITPQALADALSHHDPIKKYRPVVAEPCVINCPLAAAT